MKELRRNRWQEEEEEMIETKACTNRESKCDGKMKREPSVRYPGDAGVGVGRGLGQPLNLPAPTYGPAWVCAKCGHVEPD